MNLDTNWKFMARNIALQDNGWDYWHLGHIKVAQYTIAPIAYSYGNFLYNLYDKHTISIEIPSICKLVAQKFDEINSRFSVGSTVSIGLFRSFAALRMAAYYKGEVRISKVDSLEDAIPVVRELECAPFPQGRDTYVVNSIIIRESLLARFNF